jgi:hypothetical protein
VNPKHYVEHVTLSEPIFMARKFVEERLVSNRGRNPDTVPGKLPETSTSFEDGPEHCQVGSFVSISAVLSRLCGLRNSKAWERVPRNRSDPDPGAPCDAGSKPVSAPSATLCAQPAEGAITGPLAPACSLSAPMPQNTYGKQPRNSNPPNRAYVQNKP